MKTIGRVTTMDALFLDELRDLYDAEKQLIKALPKMVGAASSEALRETFAEHLEQTRNQVGRLERIFAVLGENTTGKKCAAMTGLLHEGKQMIAASDKNAVRDAGLIAAAQKVEHYEISGYGSARTHAMILGDNGAVRLLEETLFEEKEADGRLTELALSLINEQATLGTDAARPEGTNVRPRTRTAGGGE